MPKSMIAWRSGAWGTLFTLRQAGLVSAAWAQSAGSTADGGRLALGYNWTGHGFTVDYSPAA